MAIEPGGTPSLPDLLHVNRHVLWSWIVGVGLGFALQLGEGLGQPSQGLAMSVAALPALAVALAPLRQRRWAMLVVVGILAALALANALWHRAFGTWLPLGALRAAGQGWEVRGYALGMLEAGDALPGLAFLATLAALLPRRPVRATLSPAWHRALPVALCLLGSAPALGWALLVAPGSADRDTGGFLYAHLVDARVTAGEWLAGDEPTAGEWASVLSFLDDRSPQAPGDSLFGAAAGSNVVLLQVEALNAWVLEARVDGEPVMPFLASLVEGMERIPTVFDQTHQGRSSDADYLVLASQHPLERAAVSMSRPSLDPEALPDLLRRERGYTTFSAHAHIPGFWNAALRHRAYGFQESVFEAELGAGETVGFGLVDDLFLRRSLPYVGDLPGPWLAWLITLTMHGPHDTVPSTPAHLPLAGLEGSPLGSYLRKARHTDDAIRRFLEGVEALRPGEPTTVVIYGDHTERHRFDMSWVRRVAGVEGLPEDVGDLLLDRVPLLVVLPGRDRALPLGEPGGLLDVSPTLLHLLGLPPSPAFLGRSLAGAGQEVVAQASGEAVGGGLMWTGVRCAAWPSGAPAPADACDALRARARAELEVSWLVTRYDLGRRLQDG